MDTDDHSKTIIIVALVIIALFTFAAVADRIQGIGDTSCDRYYPGSVQYYDCLDTDRSEAGDGPY